MGSLAAYLVTPDSIYIVLPAFFPQRRCFILQGVGRYYPDFRISLMADQVWNGSMGKCPTARMRDGKGGLDKAQ